jgi:hypothetical protein
VLKLETALERRICADPQWIEGAAWGKPRSGHPEGAVIHHIEHVLANIDRMGPSELRSDLRLIALVHDTYKLLVDTTRPRVGDNDHAQIARRKAERYLADRPELLLVIELHDEAYRLWRAARADGNWGKAHAKALHLISRLGEHLPLYLAFFAADNATEGKGPDSFEWFRQIADDHSSI